MKTRIGQGNLSLAVRLLPRYIPESFTVGPDAEGQAWLHTYVSRMSHQKAGSQRRRHYAADISLQVQECVAGQFPNHEVATLQSLQSPRGATRFERPDIRDTCVAQFTVLLSTRYY